MSKEVDFETLAVQYIWEHLKRLNMGVPEIRLCRSSDSSRKTVLFTMKFISIQEGLLQETWLPIAILTDDCILRYLVGSGTVDLRGVNPKPGDHFNGYKAII